MYLLCLTGFNKISLSTVSSMLNLVKKGYAACQSKCGFAFPQLSFLDLVTSRSYQQTLQYFVLMTLVATNLVHKQQLQIVVHLCLSVCLHMFASASALFRLTAAL